MGVALVASDPTWAGGSQVLVTTPLATHRDIFMFGAGSHQSKPDCVTSTLGTWAVDLKTEHGKAMQALVMSAHAQGKEVHVQGLNVYSVWGDRESVNYFI